MTTNRVYFKTDKSGTKYYRVTTRCWKCNGSGVYSWGIGYSGATMYSGTCYACHGSGVNTSIEKEYTPEGLARLEKQRAARETKRLAKQAEYERELAARRAEEEKRQAEEEARKARSQFVGSIGDKLEVKATLTAKITYEKENYYGYGMVDSHIFKFTDSDGNIFSWFTGSGLAEEVGDLVTLKGTVKKHNEYNGAKETILTRCKITKEEA